MIQGGDPQGTGVGGPGYSIKGEFSGNGFANDLKHTPGVLSMARTMMPDSAGSQFFIMHETSPHLDGQYAAFGKICEGLDIVNKIAECATDYMDKPLEPQVMKKVTVETFGVEDVYKRQAQFTGKMKKTGREEILMRLPALKNSRIKQHGIHMVLSGLRNKCNGR